MTPRIPGGKAMRCRSKPTARILLTLTAGAPRRLAQLS